MHLCVGSLNVIFFPFLFGFSLFVPELFQDLSQDLDLASVKMDQDELQ